MVATQSLVYSFNSAISKKNSSFRRYADVASRGCRLVGTGKLALVMYLKLHLPINYARDNQIK